VRPVHFCVAPAPALTIFSIYFREKNQKMSWFLKISMLFKNINDHENVLRTKFFKSTSIISTSTKNLGFFVRFYVNVSYV
jgi:hypothetical protein